MLRSPPLFGWFFALILICAAFKASPQVTDGCDLMVRDTGAGLEMKCTTLTSCASGFTCGAGTDSNMNPGHIMHFCNCDVGSPYQFFCGALSRKCITMVAESTSGDVVTKVVLCYDCDCGTGSPELETTPGDCTKAATTATFAEKCSCP